MAWSPPSPISTKAKPRGRPVSRSMMSCTLVTVPYWENSSRSWSSVVENDMLPTYKFFATVVNLGPCRARNKNGREHPACHYRTLCQPPSGTYFRNSPACSAGGPTALPRSVTFLLIGIVLLAFLASADDTLTHTCTYSWRGT